MLSRQNHRIDEDFRAHAVAVMSELGITQEEVADALNVGQSHVNRMLSYSGNVNLPVAFVPLLNKSTKMRLFHFELLKWMARGSEVEVVVRSEDGRLDGSIMDEIAGIVKAIGNIQTVLETSPHLRVLIDANIERLKMNVRQMEREIEGGARS